MTRRTDPGDSETAWLRWRDNPTPRVRGCHQQVM